MTEPAPNERSEQAAASDQQVGANADSPPVQEDLLESLRRERASFLNYKRRVEQDRAEDRDRAHGEVLLRLLPVLDELDRALAQPPKDLESHPWVQGVEMINRRLSDVLRSLGVERVGAEGEPFDPERHEAVLYESRPDATERHVNAVFRPGYRLGDRLIRPAQVSVHGPPESTAEADQEGHSRGRQATGSPAGSANQPGNP